MRRVPCLGDGVVAWTYGGRESGGEEAGGTCRAGMTAAADAMPNTPSKAMIVEMSIFRAFKDLVLEDVLKLKRLTEVRVFSENE